MKTITMKLFINVSSIFIMILSLSSITSAQGTQQRPSQRSFATVIAKIMEKKKGRDKSQDQTKQTQHQIEGKPLVPANTSPNPALLPSRQPLKTAPVPNQMHRVPANHAPDPAQLPSRQPLQTAVKPKNI